MIATLQGEITQIEDNAVVVETGNVGLRVAVLPSVRAKLQIGEVVMLYTHMVVREDAWSLYGFESQTDQNLFAMLLGVAGVGPRTAMALLSGATIDVIQRAVFSNEPDLLGRVPGVGKKTAQKIVMYLQDKLKPTDVIQQLAVMSDADNEVLAALTALGYSVVEAQAAIQSLPKNAPQDVEERLKLALQYFARG